MSAIYNIYCDESCHLENDGHQVMILGAVWCPVEKAAEISGRLREIKGRHNVDPYMEIKWTKISASKQQLYIDILDYFFDDDDLHFRALIVPDKAKLDHKKFDGQTHDVWYYKMYFDMLKVLFHPSDKYRIYVDIKDTQGAKKIKKLHEVLCNNFYDFSQTTIERLQLVRSHEVEILQLADLLIGAIGYVNRNLGENKGKLAFVDRFKRRSRYQLDRTTLLKEEKVNLFKWQAQESQG